jgi:uncharacterized protein involved in exopolysaccharide biosynthesis
MASIFDTEPTLYNHIVIMESRNMAMRVRQYLIDNAGFDILDTYRDIKNKDVDSEDDRLRKLTERMMKRVNVEDSDRGAAKIQFLHHDPDIAAQVVNAYIQTTLDYLNEINHDTHRQLAEFLAGRKEQVDADLASVETDIETTKEETGIISVEESARQLIQAYSDIEILLAQSEIDYEGSLSTARSMENAGRDMEEYYSYIATGNEDGGLPPVPSIDSLQDAAIAKLRGDLADLEFQRQQTMLYTTPDNPEMLIINQQIESVRRELYKELSGHYDAEIASLMVESTSYNAMKNVANDFLHELDSRLDAFPPDERRLIELERDRDVLESVYLIVTQELEQAKIAELRDETPFTVLDPALPSEKPVKPRRVMIPAATMAISFWVGILIIFWVNAVDIRRTSGG